MSTATEDRLRGLTYASALRDPHLLGHLPRFKDLSTRTEQIAWLCALAGEPLTCAEAALYREATARVRLPPVGGFPRSALLGPRQIGKSELGCVLPTVDATRAAHDPALRGTYAVIGAQDSKSAMRGAFAYACEPFARVPLLRRLVVSKTSHTLTLVNDVRIVVVPCRPAAVRGLRACVVVLDEVAFFQSTDLRPLDVEMWRAAEPCLFATGGRLVALSSPYMASGLLYDLVRRHHGNDDSDTLVWRVRSGVGFNPTLDPRRLDAMRRDDPEAAASEVDGEFRSGLSLLLDGDSLDAVTDRDCRERLPVAGTHYAAGADLSGGRRDRAALAVAHRAADGTAILDCLRVYPAPHDPSVVIGDMADTLRRYGLSTVTADRFAAEFAVSQFRERGITLLPADGDQSSRYVGLLPLINAARARLLDHPLLLAELRGLERRRGPQGRDRVDHRTGAHDDVAAATSIALLLAAHAAQHPVVFWSPTTCETWTPSEARGRRLASLYGLHGLGHSGDPITLH